jgi:hypothetical protein
MSRSGTQYLLAFAVANSLPALTPMQPIFAASRRRRSSSRGLVSGVGGVVRANERLYQVASLA